MRLKIVLTAIVFGLFGQSYACKCGGPDTVKESFKSTDLIVYGKIIHKDTVLLSETIKGEYVNEIKAGLKSDKQKLQFFEMTYVVKVELEISEQYKSNGVGKSIIIYTPLLSASCGYRFERGKEYIVYASKRNFLSFMFQKEGDTERREKDNTFWTIHCTRTCKFSKAEADELRQLKNG